MDVMMHVSEIDLHMSTGTYITLQNFEVDLHMVSTGKNLTM